jgi:hypothetical protein
MAQKSKDTNHFSPEYAKHLRPKMKRQFWKGVRQKAKKELLLY